MVYSSLLVRAFIYGKDIVINKKFVLVNIFHTENKVDNYWLSDIRTHFLFFFFLQCLICIRYVYNALPTHFRILVGSLKK